MFTRRVPRIVVVLALSAVVLPPGDARADTDPMAYESKAGFAAPPRSPGRLAPVTGALFGVHSFDSHSGTPEEQGVYKLEQALGRKMDVNNKYFGEYDEIARDGLSWIETWDVENGRIPLVGWACGDSTQINSGSMDDVIRKTAQVMRDFKYEMFMRYCWEMDGERPEKRKIVKRPEDFIAAWQRMHRIFAEEGATNVVWVWTANAAGFTKKDKITGGEPPAPYYYPGDDYVDWISADGYNWGISKRDQGDRWRHFPEIFDAFMVFARQHPKPIMIAEYGAQEGDPGDKARWMRVSHQTVMDLPRTAECPWCGIYKDVAAMLYFDVDSGKHGNWQIMSTDDSLAAYKEASVQPWFHQVQTLGLPWTHNTPPPSG